MMASMVEHVHIFLGSQSQSGCKDVKRTVASWIEGALHDITYIYISNAR